MEIWEYGIIESLKLWKYEIKKPRNFETKKPRIQKTDNSSTPQHTDSHPCTRPPSSNCFRCCKAKSVPNKFRNSEQRKTFPKQLPTNVRHKCQRNSERKPDVILGKPWNYPRDQKRCREVYVFINQRNLPTIGKQSNHLSSNHLGKSRYLCLKV